EDVKLVFNILFQVVAERFEQRLDELLLGESFGIDAGDSHAAHRSRFFDKLTQTLGKLAFHKTILCRPRRATTRRMMSGGGVSRIEKRNRAAARGLNRL